MLPILDEQKSEQLFNLLGSSHLNNVLLGIQLLKIVKITPRLMSGMICNAYFTKNGHIRIRLKANLKKYFDKDFSKKLTSLLTREDLNCPSQDWGIKVHKFLHECLSLGNQIDLKFLTISVMKQTGEGFQFCLDHQLAPISEAMKYLLDYKKIFYFGGQESGRFYIEGKYAQAALNELPNQHHELNLISITQDKNKPLIFPANFSKINKINRLLLFNFDQVPAELAGIKIDHLEGAEKDQGLKSFPPGVKFPNIRYLSIRTPVTNIKNVVNLEKLSYGFGEIERLPDDLPELEKLRYFQLYHLRISNWEVLFETISRMKKLKVLSLKGCKMRKVPESICSLVELEELSLYDNKLIRLPLDFKKLTKLVRLNISYNNFDNFPTELKEMEHIEQLVHFGCSGGTNTIPRRNKRGIVYKGYAGLFSLYKFC